MILAIDVDYDDSTSRAWVSGVAFSSHNSTEFVAYHSQVQGVAEYVPSEFYKRELPCIEKLLSEHGLEPDMIIIDGFCQLSHKPCLGDVLHSKHPQIAVIGVAKNPHKFMPENCAINRGDSKRALYVTASGFDLDEAKHFVTSMDGKHRFPTLLREVDQLCRARIEE